MIEITVDPKVETALTFIPLVVFLLFLRYQLLGSGRQLHAIGGPQHILGMLDIDVAWRIDMQLWLVLFSTMQSKLSDCKSYDKL